MEEWYGQQGCRLELLEQLLRIKTQQEAAELTGQTENNQKSEFIHHPEAGDEASDVSNKVQVTKTVVNYKDIIIGCGTSTPTMSTTEKFIFMLKIRSL